VLTYWPSEFSQIRGQLRKTHYGEGLTANMEVIVREGKQIIEIQFFSNTLVGLTLVLSKG